MNDNENAISARHRAVQKRRRAKGAAFVLLFTVIGCIIGAGGTLYAMKGSFHRVRPQRDAIVAALLEKMRGRVPVSEEEGERLTGLLDAHFTEIEDIRAQSFRGVRGVFDKMDKTIESVIGGERFKIWYEYKERRLAEFRERRDARQNHNR